MPLLAHWIERQSRYQKTRVLFPVETTNYSLFSTLLRIHKNTVHRRLDFGMFLKVLFFSQNCLNVHPVQSITMKVLTLQGLIYDFTRTDTDPTRKVFSE